MSGEWIMVLEGVDNDVGGVDIGVGGSGHWCWRHQALVTEGQGSFP